MLTRFDPIAIAISDLNRATDSYRSLGFKIALSACARRCRGTARVLRAPRTVGAYRTRRPALVPGAEKDEDGLRAPADRAFGARIMLVGVRPT
jgi:hypothetical protein